ncbi:MAG TPA: hypothetical protein DEB39_01540 [Planctomycetaceae bacterium]|nr:hypothetical protein [Planctomycetaceae bacterium]
MQTPTQVLDTYFLDIRYALLEIAAMFDRYDAAALRVGEATDDPRRTLLQDAVRLLADEKHGEKHGEKHDENQYDRAETLLNLFSDLDDETQEGKKRTHPF